MRIEELRDELDEIASRAPSATTDGRAVVLERGRRLVRRRRIARAGTTLAAIAALGAGIGIWRAQTGSGPATVVTNIPTSVLPTVPTTIVPPETASTRPTPSTVGPPAVSPLTRAPATSTTLAPSKRALVAPDAGFSFFSTPVVSGHSVFVIESRHSAGSPFEARVVRIDTVSRRIVATSDQPGADLLAVAGGRVFVGVSSGSSGTVSDPSFARVVSLDATTLAVRASVTLPAPDAHGLVVGPGGVWTLAGSKAIRIDTTGRIAATVSLTLPASDPYRTLAVSGDGKSLFVGWASAREEEGVTEFDATSGATLHQNAQIGSAPSNAGPVLNLVGSRIWATFPTGMMASAVALHAGDLTTTGETLSGPNSLQLAPVGGVVWVSRGATLDCVSLNDVTLASHTLSGGVESAAAPTADAVYVSTGDGLAIITPDRSCPS
jgi:hypothetical protein